MKIRIALLSVLFALSVQAGNEPPKEIVRRHNEYVLAFPTSKKDTIFVGIRTASIADSIVGVKLCVQFPKRIDADDIVMIVTYNDNEYDILRQLGTPTANNYTEYYFPKGTDQICCKKVKEISFKGIETFKVKSKSYFKDFVKLKDKK